MLNNKKKKKGFTLIELIIVIAIIAVLAAIAMPKFGEIRKNANIKADISTAKNIYSAATAKVQEESLKPGDAINISEIMGSKPSSKVEPDNEFGLTIDSEGNVIVYIGESLQKNNSNQVYPEPSVSTGTVNEWYPN